ncbi:aminotransferase class IV [Candidatus Woesearchaeota archaeon]|nr:aminotransferase class IV [Candidatus Woesearchaeota archaeon]
MHVFINNKFYTEENAKVSVFDHGLLYGDGVFETLRAYKGSVFKISEHIDRLFHSALRIKLKIPLKKSELKEAVYSTINKNRLNEAYIRITATRGTGDIGYTSKCSPNVIIMAKEFVPYPSRIYENGVSVITHDAERFFPDVKSVSCLPLVLAKIKAEKMNCFEALLVDENGFIREGTLSNVFFIKKNELHTPKADILHGVTRNTLIKIAKPIVKIRETNIKKESIPNFNECFLTNTSAEIVPVVAIDYKKISASPGPITEKMMYEFKRHIIRETNAERH